jgi:hypothetical protein
MTETELKKAIEIAEESTNGFADDGSFEFLLATAVLELNKRLDSRPVKVSPWEFNILTNQKDDMIGKPIAWSQWPNEEKT